MELATNTERPVDEEVCCQFGQSFESAKAQQALGIVAGAKTQLPDSKVQDADSKIQLPCAKTMAVLGQKTQAADSKMRLATEIERQVARAKTELGCARTKTERVARSKAELAARAKTEQIHHVLEEMVG
jgi:hypothetical protein